MHAKHTFSKPSVVSSTRDDTFLKNNASRLHQTPTLSGRPRHRGWGWMRQRWQKHSERWCLVQAKRILSKKCPLQRASRLRETHISKIKCRLVYVRRYIFEKQCVSSTPNTYFGWRTTPSRMGMDEATMANTFQKVVSRARQMHTFKKLHSPASVSSTRDAHFQNQVLSRLHETLCFLRNCSFVYAKLPLCEAQLSPTEPSRAEPN